MKKFASIICFIFAFLPCAISAPSDSEAEIAQLKHKVATLEQLLKDDAAYIAKIRAENRSLKLKLRGANIEKPADQKPVAKQAPAEKKADVAAAKTKLEKRAEDFDETDSGTDYNPYGKKRSSVWDHMFPF